MEAEHGLIPRRRGGSAGRAAAPWTSFVALGDSFTEGLDDRRPDGSYRGWADRVAEVLAGELARSIRTPSATSRAGRPAFRYANLALRSMGLGHVIERQLPAALAMRPDLVSIAAGGNDVLRPRFDASTSAARMDAIVAALTATGATVLVFAGFDPPRLPFGSTVAARAVAYNDLVRRSARRHGAVLVDLWRLPALAHPRMWSVDRLHLSSFGHEHVTGVVLTALGVPPPPGWPAVLGPHDVPSGVDARRADLAWARHHLLPWLGRRLTGRAAGDGLTAKRPALDPLEPVETAGT